MYNIFRYNTEAVKERAMDNDIKEMLMKMKEDIKDIGLRLENIEKNQSNVANAEHKNWHMLADKLGQYDMILHKIYGKKTSDK